MCVCVGGKHNNLDRFQISCEQHIFIMFLRNILVHVARVPVQQISFNSAEKMAKKMVPKQEFVPKKA